MGEFCAVARNDGEPCEVSWKCYPAAMRCLVENTRRCPICGGVLGWCYRREHEEAEVL